MLRVESRIPGVPSRELFTVLTLERKWLCPETITGLSKTTSAPHLQLEPQTHSAVPVAYLSRLYLLSKQRVWMPAGAEQGMSGRVSNSLSAGQLCFRCITWVSPRFLFCSRTLLWGVGSQATGPRTHQSSPLCREVRRRPVHGSSAPEENFIHDEEIYFAPWFGARRRVAEATRRGMCVWNLVVTASEAMLCEKAWLSSCYRLQVTQRTHKPRWHL